LSVRGEKGRPVKVDFEEIASMIESRFKGYIAAKREYYLKICPGLDQDGGSTASSLRKLLNYEADLFFSRLQVAVTIVGLEEVEE